MITWQRRERTAVKISAAYQHRILHTIKLYATHTHAYLLIYLSIHTHTHIIYKHHITLHTETFDAFPFICKRLLFLFSCSILQAIYWHIIITVYPRFDVALHSQSMFIELEGKIIRTYSIAHGERVRECVLLQLEMSFVIRSTFYQPYQNVFKSILVVVYLPFKSNFFFALLFS